MLTRLFPASRARRVIGFTLIEMLVVIAIISILASLLLPALGRAKINAQRKVCLTEEATLAASIEQYYGDYSRLPASSNAVIAAEGEVGKAGTYSSNDFTFGNNYVDNTGANPNEMANSPVPSITTKGEAGNQHYQNNNSEIIAILMDGTNWPEVNPNTSQAHIYNPNKTVYYSPRLAAGTVTGNTFSGGPGLGSDGVLRDIWGNPYIITLDLNYDNHAFDFYMNAMYYAEYNTSFNPPGHSVIWSFGPFFNKVSIPTSANPGSSYALNGQYNRYIVHNP